MDIDVVKEILAAIHDDIKSIRGDIKDLRIEQTEFTKRISVNSESIKYLQKDVTECKECVNKMKEKGSKRVWDILTIVITGILGIFLGKHF